MSDTVEVSRDAFEPIALLVKEGLFKNEKDALKSLVLDQASSKIAILTPRSQRCKPSTR